MTITALAEPPDDRDQLRADAARTKPALDEVLASLRATGLITNP